MRCFSYIFSKIA